MTKTLFALVLGVVCLFVAGPVWADWVPADGHKMHFPQLPDEQGWDVNSRMPVVLADDWRCSRSGPVTDVHFWGSWRDVTGDRVGDVGVISSFMIRFWTDVPNPGGTGFSHPGTILWQGEVNTFAAVPIDPPTLEAWYDPTKLPEVVVPNDHGEYFQYNLDLTKLTQMPFVQQEGTIYWMSVMAIVQPETQMKEWGWKSTINHFNDDAVWAIDGVFQWTDMYEPPRVNNFTANLDPFGHFAGGGGTNFYGQGWYFYENTNWWNIWFYDNPFTTTHVKRGQIQCMIMPMVPGQPSNVTVAINWSTDAWSLQVPPPPGPPVPPLTVAQEQQFVGRQVIFSGPIGPSGHEIYEAFQLPVGYNPEWVSIDIQGVNVMIVNGVISHECYRTSLDLAFVINGPEPTGACCYPNGACAVVTRPACTGAGGTYLGDNIICLGDVNPPNGVDDACEQVLPTGACCYANGTCAVVTRTSCNNSSGTYLGDGVLCQGDNNQNGINDACEGLWPTGACCRADNTCYATSQAVCVQTGGTYLGDNTVCLGDLNGNGQDEACELTNTGACCLPNGTCASGQTRIACTMAGGQYMGDGSACAGDGNQNGVDDLCENTPDLKWFQPPDLSPTGMDVNASPDPTGLPFLLASDFRCTQAGPITEIHVFGSWLNDVLPQGNPGAVAFRLSIHPDIPDPDGSGSAYSMPGPAIWLKDIQPGNFEYRVLQANIQEGWYSPPMVYMPIGDRVCYEYIFRLGPTEFIQHGTTSDPIIYWLDVQATPLQSGTYFGWKTAVPPHQIDDAVFFNGVDVLDLQLGWKELRYPDTHVLHPNSFDLAFQIWGLEQALTGACCFDNGTCQVITQAACTTAGGTYGGNGTTCAGADVNQNGVDDFCDGIVTLGACCYGDLVMPICVNTTSTVCGQQFHGTWHSGKNCLTYQCPVSCCVGRVGDANGLGTYPNEVTISDIQLLVFAKFISSLPCEQNLHCLTEADVNQSGGVNPRCSDVTISDIQTVVNHLFIAGPPNAPLKLCF